MTLYVANAVKAGGLKDLRAANKKPQQTRPMTQALILGPFGFVKNVAQGACAGLLTLLGVMHWLAGTTPAEASVALPVAAEPGSFETIAQSLLAGGAPGVMEIVGAGALFLNAGRGSARVIGLLAFIMISIAHAKGADHADFTAYLTNLYAQLKGVLPLLQAAPM
jgi:hypothetical protein